MADQGSAPPTQANAEKNGVNLALGGGCGALTTGVAKSIQGALAFAKFFEETSGKFGQIAGVWKTFATEEFRVLQRGPSTEGPA